MKEMYGWETGMWKVMAKWKLVKLNFISHKLFIVWSWDDKNDWFYYFVLLICERNLQDPKILKLEMSKMKKARKVEIRTFFWASKVNFIKLKRAK